MISDLINSEFPKFIDPANYYHEEKIANGKFAISSSVGIKTKSLEVDYISSNENYSSRFDNRFISLNEMQFYFASRAVKDLEDALDFFDSAIPEHMINFDQTELLRAKVFLKILVEVYYSGIFSQSSKRVEFLPASRSALMTHKHIYTARECKS